MEGRRRDLVRDGFRPARLTARAITPAADVAVVVGCAHSGDEHEVVRTTGQLVLAQLGDERRCDLDGAPGRLVFRGTRAPWRSSWWPRVMVSASRSTSRQTMPNVSASRVPVSAAGSKMRRCSGSMAASRRRSPSPRKDSLGLLVGAGRPLDVIEQRHGFCLGKPRWRPAEVKPRDRTVILPLTVQPSHRAASRSERPRWGVSARRLRRKAARRCRSAAL
jgi:hypothetical protein